MRSVAPRALSGRFLQLFLFLLFILLSRDLPAADAATAGFGPPDVYIRVAVVRDELETIRFVMGRPRNEQPEIQVNAAESREVYFQALTLFHKADRLCFEHTRERSVVPVPPAGEITPREVESVVAAVLNCLRAVKAKLGIETQIVPPSRDPSKQPTDVFRSIVQANRQLNLLLDLRFTPGDVFQQVTRSVASASRLLDRFPEATTLPDPPLFEVGRRPSDVYGRLVGCFGRIRKIAELSGVHVLEFDPDEEHFERAEPSDVYDVASLLLSELQFLHSLSGAETPRKVYYPGRKFPSHVYQRAGLLERQLRELESLVGRDSGWLRRPAKNP